MLFDYLLTAFKVIVGLFTSDRLMWAAFIAIAIHLVWVILSLTFCFQKKFYAKSLKLYNYLQNNPNITIDDAELNKHVNSISRGFSYGWKRFKNAKAGKPSAFLKRRDVLDVEISGGIQNQGRSFMKAFIGFAVTAIGLINVASYANTQALTGYLLAESLVLPLVTLFVMRILYFLYTTVKQQLYKNDIDAYYELMSQLDEKFERETEPQVIFKEVPITSQNDAFETEEVAQEEREEGEEPSEVEPAKNEEMVEESAEVKQEETKEDLLDRFDIFKKKNIDVDKLANEIPTSGAAVSYINVDGDYVIKDDETGPRKTYLAAENGSDVLGGMLQNTSGIKSNKETKEEIIEDSTEEESAEKVETEEEPENGLDNLSAFELGKKPNENEVEVEETHEEPTEVENEVNEAEKVETLPEPEENEETVEESENAVGEANIEPEAESTNDETFEETPSEETEFKTDEINEEQEIASLVGGFKARNNRLATGGVVVERNDNFGKRNRSEDSRINVLNLEDNTDNIVSTFSQGSAPVYPETPVYYGAQNVDYGVPVQPNMNYNGNYQDYGVEQMYNYDPNMNNFSNYSNNFVDYGQDPYSNNFAGKTEEVQKSVEKKKASKSKVVSKPKATKPVEKKQVKPVETKQEEVSPAGKRGRPKKQVFDETITIKDDKEFDQVLSRAEKLMRKSDEGLSQSQSKRIEKELKMLMDAMNRYKERR
ncbi:MAG: hypothetical protein IJ538_03910 [Clostridia bacterium]|nr:hypothetical protein [Clostridia bacterium]